MRALMLSWEYPPVIEGGLGRHVAGLSAALTAGGWPLAVVTRGAGGGVPAREHRGSLEVHRITQPAFPRELDAFLEWVDTLNRSLAARAREVIDAGGCDIVHSHDWLVADAARRSAAHAGAPWLVTVHATEHGRHGGRIGQAPQSIIHAAERAMIADADRLVVCSEAMRAHLLDVFGVAPERLTALRNGVDLDAPSGSGEDPSRLRARLAPGGERIVLLAGRLVYEKGFDLALAALAGLAGVRTVIAGAGPAHDELRGHAEALGLSETTHFTGWVDDTRLSELYGIADVCVVPSRYEPFGIVALEAMRAGTPCVLTDVGGLAELAGDADAGADGGAALGVASGDVRALRAAIARLLADDALRARLADAGRARVRAYGWPAVATATRAVYEQLTGRTPR